MTSNVNDKDCAAYIDSLLEGVPERRFFRINALWDLRVGPSWVRPMERAGDVFDLRLHIVRGGKGTYLVDGNEIPMSKGLVMLFSPPLKYGHFVDKSDPPSLISCHFDLVDAETGEPLRGEAPPFFWTSRLDVGEHERVLPFFDNVSRLYRETVERRHQDELRSSALHQLLGLTQELCLTVMRKEFDMRVEAARIRIERNPLEATPFSKIADDAGLGPDYFSRLFKRQVGMSPKRYRMKSRMEYASFLLSQGSGVKEVADAMGYSDPFVFSRLFKRAHGVSPSKMKS